MLCDDLRFLGWFGNMVFCHLPAWHYNSLEIFSLSGFYTIKYRKINLLDLKSGFRFFICFEGIIWIDRLSGILAVSNNLRINEGIVFFPFFCDVSIYSFLFIPELSSSILMVLQTAFITTAFFFKAWLCRPLLVIIRLYCMFFLFSFFPFYLTFFLFYTYSNDWNRCYNFRCSLVRESCYPSETLWTFVLSLLF